MSRSSWILGDFDGKRYIDMKSLYGREVVRMLDYVVVDGVKFVSERKLHDERVRELEEWSNISMDRAKKQQPH